MALANYSDLKAAIANWLARDDLTSVIPDFIMLGERRMYRDLRIRAMETALSETIASSVITVPSDYVELKNAYIDGTPVHPLGRVTAEEIYQLYPDRSNTDKPFYIGREAGNFIFGPAPDSTYTVKGIYYARLTALSDSNTTNWITNNAPDVILYAALLEASIFIEDQQKIEKYSTLYGNAVKAVQDEDNNENFSGSVIRAQAG